MKLQDMPLTARLLLAVAVTFGIMLAIAAVSSKVFAPASEHEATLSERVEKRHDDSCQRYAEIVVQRIRECGSDHPTRIPFHHNVCSRDGAATDPTPACIDVLTSMPCRQIRKGWAGHPTCNKFVDGQ